MSILATNPKARYAFDLKDTFEGGLALTGAEARAASAGNVNIKGAFVSFRGGELWLRNAYIGHYLPAGKISPELARRDRKILVHASELRTLLLRHESERLTMIPLDLHSTPRKRVKITFALAKGKRSHEKRAAIKKRDLDRDLRRLL